MTKNNFVADESDMNMLLGDDPLAPKDKTPVKVKEVRERIQLPEVVEKEKRIVVDGSELVKRDSDFTYMRENLYNIIEVASNALNDLAEIASQRQHPRDFEVLGDLVRTISAATKDLGDLHKTKVTIRKEENSIGEPEEGSSTNVTNNNVFVGNTSELDEIISKITGNKARNVS
jgi:Terminase DNA packaging enzyme